MHIYKYKLNTNIILKNKINNIAKYENI